MFAGYDAEAVADGVGGRGWQLIHEEGQELFTEAPWPPKVPLV
jgi:hypothetical protein